MRKYFLIIVLLSFTCLFSQEKSNKSVSELEVQYEYSFVRDTTDTDPNHRFKELMLLDFNSKSSIFYSQQYAAAREAVKKATAAAQTSSNVEIKAAELPKYKVGYSVYREDSKIYFTSNINRDFFTFENTYLTWNTNYKDVKTILGYKCNKAITKFGNRVFTAWYTKDIPISEGPYRFKGLTGLVLEVSDKNKFHSFTAVGIVKKAVEIEPLQKGIPVTKEQYIKKREEFKNNPYPQSKTLTKERRDQMIEAFKKDNNSIEN
ncbi:MULTISPECIES: GLPGLI family protein [unclassified Chryseobacterium]|uniref:GLPGLI family protein n=1 Tax=unclassified Chryseobacterium TaxID=2593645 RepID=UPI001AE8A4B5|nr:MULTISPECIES: GLPGLI family protein [unclassified Chryseobacterium]MBP1163762.1 GLPGLI family protein [Chryseobacterium sp. PvR013]MDR4894081.1 GLPGLI family protein [Chryseobacterium sp. CFS7]